MWTFNEGGDFLIRVDATGQKQWGSRISWGDFNGGATALAYDNGVIYVAKDGNGGGATSSGGLFLFDATNGRRMNFPNGQGTLSLSVWPSKEALVTSDVSPSVRMHNGEYGPADLSANILGLAATPDRLYVSLYLDNKIAAIDKQTGKVMETFTVNRPSGLAYDAQKKQLYALSGDTIVAVDAAGKTTPIVASGLTYPFGLTVDDKSDIFVSVRGKQMQVLEFDSMGQPIRAIGKTGGRPWIGKFDPDGMLLPSGLSVDTKNHVWVTEDDATPKRISLWDASTGKLINDFYGSAMYAVMMAPDPEKPEDVYLHNCRFVVDYDKGTWRPDSTIFRAGYDGVTIPGSDYGYGFMGSTFEIGYINGKKFALNGNGGIFSADSDIFKPVMYLGPSIGAFPPLDPAKQEYAWTTSYRWTDSNHNGLVEPSEVEKLQGAGGLYGNIAQFGGAYFPDGAFIKGGRIFRPTGIGPDGMPQYPDPSAAPPIVKTKSGPISAYPNMIDLWPVYGTNYKQYYTITSLPAANNGLGGGGGDCIARFDSDGNILWRYTRAAVFYALNAPLAKTGDLYGAERIAGEFNLPPQNGGGVVGIGCYRGYFGYLNEDGLYIDQTGYDNGRGPATNFDTFFIENFSGFLFKHPRTGKVYLFCGDVDGRILEIQGWDKIPPADAVPAYGDRGRATATALESVAEGIRRYGGSGYRCKASHGRQRPKLDGGMQGWSDDQFSSIPLDEKRHARVALAYDAKNLYARFDVQDMSPWKNSSTDWHFLFKGGDAVDIQLGKLPIRPATAPSAPHSRAMSA